MAVNNMVQTNINKYTLLLEDFYNQKLAKMGVRPESADYNRPESQVIRFTALEKMFTGDQNFSLLDYGCGYGAFADFLEGKGFTFDYEGYDITEGMILAANQVHASRPERKFFRDQALLRPRDYLVACGIYSMKFDADPDFWLQYIVNHIDELNALATKGFAFNMLTSYADADKMRPDLYYGDPGFFFDLCKKKYSSNVALLHDYQLYDWTIIVRKG